jgi:hypothetical protein
LNHATFISVQRVQIENAYLGLPSPLALEHGTCIDLETLQKTMVVPPIGLTLKVVAILTDLSRASLYLRERIIKTRAINKGKLVHFAGFLHQSQYNQFLFTKTKANVEVIINFLLF